MLAGLGPFRRAYLLRGLALWLFSRLAAAFVGIWDPNPAEEALILGVAALAVYLDARRRGEDLFLANLGIRPWVIPAWALPVALLAEFLVP